MSVNMTQHQKSVVTDAEMSMVSVSRPSVQGGDLGAEHVQAQGGHHSLWKSLGRPERVVSHASAKPISCLTGGTKTRTHNQ